ncbi:hypothetical protein PR048_014154 [Dryococelus australis]|uniref:Uncharacterized protein n=1 Tax=Dryococelus australis TaxID=614101 RepID=A0ABQ9HDN7_9NEOP|nr:hypothetical protein PR048_014154 [Dryococelus australis]
MRVKREIRFAAAQFPRVAVCMGYSVSSVGRIKESTSQRNSCNLFVAFPNCSLSKDGGFNIHAFLGLEEKTDVVFVGDILASIPVDVLTCKCFGEQVVLKSFRGKTGGLVMGVEYQGIGTIHKYMETKRLGGSFYMGVLVLIDCSRLRNSSRTPQQNGVTGQMNVGTVFANQRLLTYNCKPAVCSEACNGNASSIWRIFCSNVERDLANQVQPSTHNKVLIMTAPVKEQAPAVYTELSSLAWPSADQSSVTCSLDSAIVCTNMQISTAHWLSAVTVEGDDWASLFQEASNSVWSRHQKYSLDREQPTLSFVAVFVRRRFHIPPGHSEFDYIGTARDLTAESKHVSAGMQGRGKWEIPENIRRPAGWSGTSPTCEKLGETPPVIKHSSPRWEATPLWLHTCKFRVVLYLKHLYVLPLEHSLRGTLRRTLLQTKCVREARRNDLCWCCTRVKGWEKRRRGRGGRAARPKARPALCTERTHTHTHTHTRTHTGHCRGGWRGKNRQLSKSTEGEARRAVARAGRPNIDTFHGRLSRQTNQRTSPRDNHHVSLAINFVCTPDKTGEHEEIPRENLPLGRTRMMMMMMMTDICLGQHQLGSPLVDDRPIINAVMYRLLSGVARTNRAMVSVRYWSQPVRKSSRGKICLCISYLKSESKLFITGRGGGEENLILDSREELRGRTVYKLGSENFANLFQDKIDVKHVYTEVAFAIGSQFIIHALDDSEPIADLQGNYYSLNVTQLTDMCVKATLLRAAVAERLDCSPPTKANLQPGYSRIFASVPGPPLIRQCLQVPGHWTSAHPAMPAELSSKHSGFYESFMSCVLGSNRRNSSVVAFSDTFQVQILSKEK